MKNILWKSLVVMLLATKCATNSYALEKETHKAINEHIVQNTLNSFSLSLYLKNQLGFQNGIDEKLIP